MATHSPNFERRPSPIVRSKSKMQLIIILRSVNFIKIKNTKSLKYNRESERMKMEYSDQALKLEAGFNQIRQDLEKDNGTIFVFLFLTWNFFE